MAETSDVIAVEDVDRRRRRLALGCLAALLLVICLGIVLLFRQYEVATEQVLDLDGTATAASTLLEPVETAPPSPTVGVEEEAPVSGWPSARIVFTDGGRLGTVGSDGAGLRFLSGDESRLYLFPVWSPDGLKIAAIAAERGGSGVYVLSDTPDAELSELYFSSAGAPIYLYWQPDGRALSYIASGEGALNLYLSPADGRGTARLLHVGQPLYWDWVDETSRLVVHTGSPTTGGQLTLLDLGEGQESNAASEEIGYFQAPGVSAGGDYLSFALIEDERRMLAVQNLGTNELQTVPHSGIVAMGWSPLEQKLAYISPDETSPASQSSFYGPLRLFDPATGELRVATEQTVLAFFWSPDGRMIAYFTLAEDSGEQVARSPHEGASRPAAKVRRQNDELYLSLSIIDVAGGGIHHVIDFQPSELFLRQFLPFFDQYALSHRLWSPNSSALVLPVVEDERARIYVIPVSGLGLQAVADGEIAFWSPH